MKERPFSVTLMLWLVLVISGWGLARFTAAIRWWNELIEFRVKLTPIFLSVTGLGWCICGFILFFALRTTRSWARLATPVAFSIWLLEYWIERLVFQSGRTNSEFALIFSIIGTAVIFAAAIQSNTKYFLLKSEEYEQPDKNPNSS